MNNLYHGLSMSKKGWGKAVVACFKALEVRKKITKTGLNICSALFRNQI
jgi:hypothetical protein